MNVARLEVILVGPARFPVAPPYAGGLESFVGGLAGALRGRGHSVRIVAGTRRPSQRSGRRDIPSDGEDLEADGRSICDALLTAVGRRPADVIHHNGSTAQVLQLADAARHFELSLHTPPLDHLVAALTSLPEVRTSTVSNVNAERWQQALGRSPAVVPNGVDRSIFRPAPRRRGHLAWAGRLVPEKGAHVAIEAARLLEMPLRIAGPVHDQRYFDDVIRPQLGASISYVGHLAAPELAGLLATATVTLVTPLWDEPFGLVVAESLSCGTPVAALPNGSLAAGRTFPTDVVNAAIGCSSEALAAAALEVRAVSSAACRAASAPFGLELMAAVYEARYLAGDLGGATPC